MMCYCFGDTFWVTSKGFEKNLHSETDIFNKVNEPGYIKLLIIFISVTLVIITWNSMDHRCE
jgi:hypothetical protein